MTAPRSGDQESKENSTAIFDEYTVVSGDSLINIVKDRAKKLGVEVSDEDINSLVKKICDLNDILNKDLIQPGQLLNFPTALQKPSRLPTESRKAEGTMAEKKLIRVGSIIHLENVVGDSAEIKGGYLDTRGWVTDKSVISQFQDERLRKFVSTHESADRIVGSGSWLILSADGKKDGDPLVAGDKIHLLNMHPGSGYLDTFEWVNLLVPFEGYPMQIGVFATSTPKRDGGPTGTWTIRFTTDEPTDDKLVEGGIIYLKNDYSSAGFLSTYDGTLVTEHPLFNDYEGQQRFVFTTPDETQQHGSRTWKVTLSNLPENLYRLQNQWDGERAFGHEARLFKIGNRRGQPIIALNFTSDDQGKRVSGTVKYKGEPSIEGNFNATHRSENIYDVEIRQSMTPSQWLWDGQWLLGSRKHQKIIAMALESIDDGVTLKGTITYAGESPISFNAIRGFKTISDIRELLDDVLQIEWIKGRSDKMESVIVANDRLLSDVFEGISGISINDVMQHIYQIESESKEEDKKEAYEGLKQLWAEEKPGETQGSFDALDRDFQIAQLLNLYRLSQLLNSFSRYTLYQLMECSLSNHRDDKDEPVAPLHLFRRCFERIATDHKIIEHATRQRQWHRELKGNYLSAQAVKLLILDKLAIKAVAPFQHLLVDPQSVTNDLVMITYLSERTHIHLMPYTKQFILIGVSYDRVPPAASIFDGKEFIGKNLYAFELMAIPHEVGHYVYHHGKLNGKTFSEMSEKFEDNPYYRWSEELFADVYGCIVAGPLAAISMQALLMSIDRDRAWKDDEEHPTPVLRVFIFAEILRILAKIKIKGKPYQFPMVADKLDQDWAEILKLWGYDPLNQSEGRPTRVYMHDNSALHLDTIVNVKRVMKAIRPMIEEFATRLLGVAYPRKNVEKQNIPWSRYDTTTTGLYNVEMHRMVNLNFAREEFPSQFLLNIQVAEALSNLSHPNESLQQYLKEWGDSGPYGWGGH